MQALLLLLDPYSGVFKYFIFCYIFLNLFNYIVARILCLLLSTAQFTEQLLKSHKFALGNLILPEVI